MKIMGLTIILLVSFACLSLAEAQTESEGGFKVDVELSVISGADIEDSGTEIGVTKVDFSASYLCFTFDYGLSSYRWNDVNTKLPFGNGTDDPWDDLHNLSLGLRFAKSINDSWSYFALASLSSAFEEEMDDSFGCSFAGGIMYKSSPEWELRLGALLSYDEVDEFEVFPVGAILWNQEAQTGWSAVLGLPQTYLRYKFTPGISSKLAFSFAQDLYRLADESTVEAKGYFKDEALVLGLHLDMAVSEDSLLSIGGEYIFAREFSIYDEDGSDKSSHDIDEAFGGMAKFSYTF